MFTGIVASTGEIIKTEPGDAAMRLHVRGAALDGAEVGASVAVSGVCLTVTARDGDTCTFDVAAETLARTTLGTRAAGDLVNLERPLRAGEEFGGHIVQGHVDGVGTVVGLTTTGDGTRLTVRIPPGLGRYVVEKGSITLDGVSLTVAGIRGDEAQVALIPHTLAVTSLHTLEAGSSVNIEVDLIAKHIEKLVGPHLADGEPDDGGYL